jgi:hypothetical protein
MDKHEAKSQSIAVVDGVTVVTKEGEEIDIAEIIGELVEQLGEEEDKQDCSCLEHCIENCLRNC